MKRKGPVVGCTMLLSLVCIMFMAPCPVSAGVTGVIYSYNFEPGWDGWHPDNGVWEVGTPTSGPKGCYRGTKCAATVLAGDFPAYTSSRLISPEITLPVVTGDEALELRFWHWFSYGSSYGFVQISYYDPQTSSWSNWETISTAFDGASIFWTPMHVDLSAYSGMKVKLGFYHNANYSISSGWYIDAVEVVKMIPQFDGTFEAGWGDWYPDHSVWEVGTPTSGPKGCYEGTKCAATVLAGDFPAYTSSRLIYPAITLPLVTGDEPLELRFWHWFSYGASYGYVQISYYDPQTAGWSAWETRGGPYEGTSSVWTPVHIDLSAYSGMKVKLGFYHNANYSTSSGWYIDAVEIYHPEGKPVVTISAHDPVAAEVFSSTGVVVLAEPAVRHFP